MSTVRRKLRRAVLRVRIAIVRFRRKPAVRTVSYWVSDATDWLSGGIRRMGNGLLIAFIIIGALAPALFGGMFSQVSAGATSQGPRTATASGDCVNNTGTGTVAWTSPGNAFSDNTTYASVSVDGTVSNYILCTNYGFSLPSNATVTGIIVSVERKSDSTGNGGSKDSAVRVVKGGSVGSTDKSTATTYTTSDVKEDHGGSSDLWSDSWAYSDINASNFGAAFAATKASSAGAAHSVTVDVIQITVHYTVPDITYTQASYRWFENNDATTVGSPLGGVSQDTATSAAPEDVPFRLRVAIHVAGASVTAGSVAFKLQFAPQGGDGVCDASYTGESYTDVTASSVIAYYNNPSVSDGATVTSSANDPVHSGHTNVYQGYEELNNAAVTSTIAAGQDGVWDFALVDNGAPASKTYCFRIRTSSAALDTYSVFPEITTLPADFDQTGYRWFGGQGGVANNTFLQVLGEDTSGEDNYGNSMRMTADGGYIVVGSTESYGSGTGADLLLTKLDVAGVEEWSKTLGASSQDDIGTAVVQTADGSYVVAGTTAYGAGDTDIWLAKFDSSGVEQWTKTLGGTGDSTARSLIRTSDGGFVVAGSTDGYGAGSLDVLLAKFDSSGVEQWTKTLGGTGDDEAYAVVQTADNGYAVTGYTAYGAGSDDVLLAKFDSSGVEQWTKTLGGASSDQGNALVLTSDGSFVVAGRTASYGAGSDDVLLAKFDSSGVEQWTKTLGGASSDQGNAVALTDDGGFAVAGRTASGATGNEDLMLSVFNSSGVEQLTTTFTSGASSYSRGLSIVSSPDGGYAVVGARALSGSGYDVVIAKFTGAGEIDDCTGNGCTVQSLTESNQTITESAQSLTESDVTSSTSMTVENGQAGFGVTLGSHTIGYALVQDGDTGDYTVGGDGGAIARFSPSGVEQETRYITIGSGDVVGLDRQNSTYSGVVTAGSSAVRGATWSGPGFPGAVLKRLVPVASGTLDTYAGYRAIAVGANVVSGTDTAYFLRTNPSGLSVGASVTIPAGTTSHARSIADNGSGYVIAGDATYTTQQVLLTNISTTGVLSGTKTLAVGDSATGYDVIVSSDGGFVVVGSTTTGSDEDILISKFNSSGVEQWTKTLGSSGADRAYSVAQTYDGGYAVTGSTTSFGAGGSDILISKFNSSGVEQWTKTIGSSGTDTGRGIIETDDGSLALTGSYNSVLALVKVGASGQTAGCTSGCTYQTLTESDVSVTETSRSVTSSAMTLTTDTTDNAALGTLTRSESYFMGYGLWTDLVAIPAAPLGSQDAAGTATRHDAPLRLRGVLRATKTVTAGSGDLKLQVAARVGTCDIDFTGEDYDDVGPSAAFDYYDENSLDDGVLARAGIRDPSVGGTLNYGTYVESPGFITNQAFAGGDYGLWDFSVTATDSAVYGSYCFRVVYDNNTLLHDYSSVSEISLPPAASQQLRHGAFFDTAAGTRQPIYW